MSTQRNTQEFLDILERNRKLIYKVCFMFGTDTEHIKDLYQEVVANLWQGINSFSERSNISTWIYRVALNTCVTYFRKSYRHSNTVPIESILDLTDDADSTTHATNLRELYELISTLGNMDKAIIMLWLDEHSYDEISEITGISKNNVASRLHRIRQRLIKQSNQ